MVGGGFLKSFSVLACCCCYLLAGIVGVLSESSVVYRDEVCGQVQVDLGNRIGNGDLAEEGEWPWHGAMFHKRNYQCGCTLIGEWLVLTAAHCLYNPNSKNRYRTKELRVVLGLHGLHESTAHTREYGLKDTRIHPSFDPSGHKHDIALLLLDNRVTLGLFVRPIGINFEEPPWIEHLAGHLGTVVGWGFTEQDAVSDALMIARMPIARYTDCVESSPDVYGHLIHNGMYCAGAKNGTNVCNGDSGGGMYIQQQNGNGYDGGGQWTIRGVVSFAPAREGTNLCDLHSYAAFTNVAFYSGWIREQSKELLDSVSLEEGPKPMEPIGGQIQVDDTTSTTTTSTTTSTTTTSTTTTTTTTAPTPVEFPTVRGPPAECLQQQNRLIKVERDSSLSLLCNTDSTKKAESVRWYHHNYVHQTVDLSTHQGFSINATNDILALRHLEARSSGKYFCKAIYNDTSVSYDNRTVVVSGVIPKFSNGAESSFMRYNVLLKRNYLNLKITFKADVLNGLLLWKSDECGQAMFSLALVEGRIEFNFQNSLGVMRKVALLDHIVQLNNWHTIEVYLFGGRGYVVLDNRYLSLFEDKLFVSKCYTESIYLGSAPQANTAGFTGCINQLVLNDHIINLWKEAEESRNIQQCNPCLETSCLNGGVCIENLGRKGYSCFCQQGFAGSTCSSVGESCSADSCSAGSCETTEQGMQCQCPYFRTGKRCEQNNVLTGGALSFRKHGFSQYKLPIQTNFDLQFSFTARQLNRGMMAYIAEDIRRVGNFLALVIKDNRLELRFSVNLELHPNSLESTIVLQPNTNHTVKLGFTSRLVYLQVDEELTVSQNFAGELFSMASDRYLYLGGIDRHTLINRCPEITEGFDGCIRELIIPGFPLDIAENFVIARNIENCT
ncbi:basement membrane-specific heparan sulfate proteoglycan core protein-like [Uranotaenia lowii]|uniref:basement membrane-specific heparan sulfate proteoglycan core protein-like n=1 Tax=Uranotaenia lowii TaxID=190385 RepID=UPI0024787A43|nr:basement membrane-specific heparan sulfate proteoglycan core protein-like [Uranotaenia lowii]